MLTVSATSERAGFGIIQIGSDGMADICAPHSLARASACERALR